MTAPVIEALLLRWSESHNGRTVTLQLPADGEHPFRGLPCGPAHGQRLWITCHLIDTDETTTPLGMPAQAPDDGGNGKGAGKHRLSQQAALCCQDARFRRFLEEFIVVDEIVSADHAAEVVRHACNVKSRSEFDTDPAAGERWRDFHGEYIGWLHAP